MSSRTLKLTSPAMAGSDVERFQKDVNAELARWHVPLKISEDGTYGVQTRDAAKSVAYGLGLASPVLEHGATPAIRLKVRNRELTQTERTRFNQRKDWRVALAVRYGQPSTAVQAALDYARAHIGVTESPPGSNRGTQIDQWERDCGVLGAPWCGCFAAAVLAAGGFPVLEWLRYCPSIEAMARNHQEGWTWEQMPRPGDLVLYGPKEADHVGIVESVLPNGGRDDSTIEGNTSNGPGGSQSNGGIVARRHRHTDGSLVGFPIRGYARPPWKQ